MGRLNQARVAGLAVMCFGFVLGLTAVATAQIHGVPASVTSIGFGGQWNQTPGVPASITSLGPNGFRPNNPFFNQPTCCINPLFPINPNPPIAGHHHHGGRFPAAFPVYGVPYAPVVVVEQPVMQVEPDYTDEEEYNGGPTIFDRRGPGKNGIAQEPYPQGQYSQGPYSQDAYPQNRNDDRYAGPPRRDERASEPAREPAAEAEAVPVASQPETLLVFKDGHQVEVENYAIVGDTLFDLSGGRRRKIALAELDLTATAKQNDDRGIDFQLPAGFEEN